MEQDHSFKPKSHELGMSLDPISEDELVLRIELLEREILRLRAEIEIKKSSKAAADAVFKI